MEEKISIGLFSEAATEVYDAQILVHAKHTHSAQYDNHIGTYQAHL